MVKLHSTITLQHFDIFVSHCKHTIDMYKLLLTTQMEKKNHDLAPERVIYVLTRSFSHASHYCGHDSSPPNAVYTVTGGPQYCDHLQDPCLKDLCGGTLSRQLACACA